jgi:hypothetical protein
VAFEDYGNAHKVSVMKFDGVNWIYIGNAGFSSDTSYFESLRFSSSGEPYVAFVDYGNFRKATVMRYNGTNWVIVGNAGFSAGVAGFTSLTFSPSGVPYVAYEDCANGYGATVMKYDSVYVGINELLKSTLSLYPNPATDNITVEISGKAANGSNLSILNIEGQALIARQITKPKTQIDISLLPSGVYFVRVTGERTVEVGKIVKRGVTYR